MSKSGPYPIEVVTDELGPGEVSVVCVQLTSPPGPNGVDCFTVGAKALTDSAARDAAYRLYEIAALMR